MDYAIDLSLLALEEGVFQTRAELAAHERVTRAAVTMGLRKLGVG